jgi:hypothetical protein
VVGESTYGTAYHGSTRDYYREARRAVDELSREGRQVELWANLEAFEPSGVEGCSRHGARGRTDKKRLDQAVAMAGPYVSKIISYMWSDFYTCQGAMPQTLSEEIASDYDRPIVIDARREAAGDGRDGVFVRGYNLADARISFTLSGGKPPATPPPATPPPGEIPGAGPGSPTGTPTGTTEVDVAAAGWVYDGRDPALPERVQAVWVPFAWAGVPQGSVVTIDATNRAGKRLSMPFPLSVP